MSEKCRKRPLSKNEEIIAVRHYQENNYQGDELHSNCKKTDYSVHAYKQNKISTPFHFYFFSYTIPMFSILGLKYKLKPKL